MSRAAQLSATFLQQCFAQPAGTGKVCGITPGDFSQTGDDAYQPGKLDTTAWTVGTYPVVEMEGGDGPNLAGRVRTPGTVTLHATGTDFDGKRKAFSLTCQITDEGLYVRITADGKLAIAPIDGIPLVSLSCPH